MMDQEEKLETKKSGGKGWLWIVIIVVVIVAGVAIWYFTKNDESKTSDSATEVSNNSATVAPKHADWQVFSSKKYKFKLYYPTEYTLAEGATGTITLSKGTSQMVDLYVYDASGDSGQMVKSQVTLFTDDTKGYMTGGADTETTAAGQSANIISGTFGKNAGISQTHAGVKGSAVVFTKNNLLFIVDSYDNGDTAAQTIFTDIMADMRFEI